MANVEESIMMSIEIFFVANIFAHAIEQKSTMRRFTKMLKGQDLFFFRKRQTSMKLMNMEE